MHTLLLVDDEVLALQYVSSFACIGELGFRVVGCARNGKEGLELFGKHRADVLLSDIRMPVMDGIEMLRRIRSMRQKQPVVYLLTAYQDFAYAKSAIDLQVNGYILKHEITNETLRETLTDALNLLRQNDMRQVVLTDRCLKDAVLFGNEENVDAVFGDRRYLPVVVHKPLVYYSASNRILHSPEEDARAPIADRLSRFALSESDMPLCDLGGGAYLWLLPWSGGVPLTDDIARDLCQELRAILGLPRSGYLLVYPREAYPVRRLHEWYLRYRAAAEDAYLCQREDVVALAELEARRELAAPRDFAEIERYMQQKQFRKSVGLMRQLALSFETERGGAASFLEAMRRCLALIQAAIQNLSGYTEKMKDFEAAHIGEVDRALAGCERQLDMLFETSRFSPKVNAAVTCIHKRYDTDLSVEQIAREAHISLAYLSRIFKKETGMTIVDSLTRFRMERAKELLTTTELKIFEVAKRVGYQSSQYFSSVFRKSEGVSPYEYREKTKE